jgi:hypothetical protein
MKIAAKRNNLEFLLHIGIWILVYSLPFLIFWNNGDTNLSDKLLHHIGIVLSLLAIFYTNYFYLIEKFLFNKRLNKYFLYNIAFIMLLSYGVHVWNEDVLPQGLNQLNKPELSKSISFFFRDMISLIMVAGLSVALKTTGKWYQMEADRQEEDKKRTEAELLALRQQINPHFLFNTLNNIYALIEISPEKAQTTVHELSKLMRYVLYENSGETVALNKEITFLDNYIKLMKIRLTDEVEIAFENKIPMENNWQITPMLFISLVENAFKHGVSPTHKSFIHVAFDVLDNNKLSCTIENSYFPKNDSDLAGSGIGLENLKRRLEILYPDKHEFHSGELNGIYYSRIIVPLLMN